MKPFCKKHKRNAPTCGDCQSKISIANAKKVNKGYRKASRHFDKVMGVI